MNKPNPEQLEKLRIRVAELCGWKMLPRDKWLHKGDPNNRHPSGKIASLLRGEPATEIPNYPEDLNATHEAEKVLLTQDIRRALFAQHLEFLSGFMADEDHREYVSIQSYDTWIELPASDTFKRLIHAEAWQRCIALDRTLSEEPIL